MHLALISLRAEDPVKLSDWYVRHFGLKVISPREGPDIRILGTDSTGARLLFLPGKVPHPAEAVQLHFQVADVNATYEKMLANGVEFIEPPTDMRWGWRHAYAKDPAGYIVELVSPLTNAKWR